MPENSVELNLKATGLEQGRAATNVLKGYREELDKSWTSSVKAAQGAKELTGYFSDFKGAPLADKLFGDFNKFDTRVKYAKQDIDELADSIAKVGSESEKLDSSRKLFSTGSQLSSSLGIAGGSQAFGAAGGITDTLRDLPKLKEALFSLPPTMLAAGAATGALVIALDLYNKEQERTKKLVLEEIGARERALDLIATGTKEEIQLRINALTQEKQIAQAHADDAKRILEQGEKDITNSLGLVVLGLEQAAAATGRATGAYQAAYDSAHTTADQLGKTSTELDLLTKSSGLAAKSIDEIVAAAQRVQLIQQDISNRAGSDLEAYKLANDPNAGQDQLNARIRDLQLELAVTENSAAAVRDRALSLGLETEAGKVATAEADKLTIHQNQLQTSLEVLSQSFVRTAVAAHDLTNEQEAIRSQGIASTIKYNDAIVKNDENYHEQLAAAQTKYNDTLVNIAEQGAKAAENAYIKLKDKQTDLLTSFADNETDAAKKQHQQDVEDQLKFAQEVASNARKHANELLKIERDNQAKTENLTLARDFAGLYQLQRDKTRQISESNIAYNQEAAARLEAYQNQQTLDLEHYQQDEETRATAYQRQAAQANLAYGREQQALDKNIRESQQKAYNDYVAQQNILYSKYNNQILQLNQSIQAELQLQQQGQAASLALQAQYWAQAQAIYANGGSTANGASASFSGGSSLDIPRASSVNSSSSVTTNNSRNTSVALNQTITGGGDSQAIARAAANAARVAIQDLLT